MIRSLLCLAFVVSFTAAFSAEPTYYVAPPPVGNDAQDGTRETPFATLDRARLAVRAQRAARESGGGETIVELKSGYYELAAPVQFEAADSGEPGRAVVYRAEPGGTVVLSGGRRVSGWRTDEPGVVAADLGSGVDFRQLWIEGRRGVRARTPNRGAFFQMTSEKQADGFELPRAPFDGVTVRPGEVEISVLIAWMHKRLRIARLGPGGEGESVRAVIEAQEWEAVTRQPQGDRVYFGRNYWLENAPEFLDAPGEFYLDRSAGIVKYRLRAGEEAGRLRVVRPEIEQLIVLSGTLEEPVHDLRFEGLTFAHTGWTRPNRHGFVDVQANSLVPADLKVAVDSQYRHQQRKDRVPAAFQAVTADRVVVRGCHFRHVGGTGVMFTGGGDDNVIEGNSFYDLAAGGIEIGEDAARPENERLIPKRNRVSNNFLTRIGADYWGSVAILGYYTDGTEITRNEIANVPYTAVSQGWGWGNPSAPEGSRANRITMNRVSNYMRRLDDGGGIYTTDRMPGSEIAGNVLEHMLTPDAHTKAGGALYLDQFTEGVHVHHNVVSEAVRWLYIWNPNIRGNRVETNYADTAAQRNDGTDNVVEPVNLFARGDMPEEARRIVAEVGIAPAFERARAYAHPDSEDVIIESADVDIHLAGDWETIAMPGAYGATVKRARSKESTARVWPVLPWAGEYDVSVWTSEAGARGNYVIRHAEGETPGDVERRTPARRVANAVEAASAASASADAKAGPTGEPSDMPGWRSLGRFRFKAGIGAELRLNGAEGMDGALTLDALRFVRVKE